MAKTTSLFKDKRNISAIIISTIVHVVLLGALRVIYIAVDEGLDDLAFDSLMTDTKTDKPEPLKVLQTDNSAATTLNTQTGGKVSKIQTKARTRVAAAQPVKMNTQLEEMVPDVAPTDLTGIGRDALGDELGDVSDFKGEATAVVDGYGAALSQITQEIRRLMRNDKLLVVWLFDESESMKDDQKDIAQKFGKIYQELNLVKSQDEVISKKVKRRRKTRRKLKGLDPNEVLLTAIYGYGQRLNKLLDPTADHKLIQSTIEEKIPIDESGKENMCMAIKQTIDIYRSMAARQKRKIVIIVVSDESGDDGMAVELTLREAKKTKTPLYFLGREAIFGYPYARHRWVDKKYGLTHWLRINRGPETAFPECLQWDGLHARWDAFSSGFAPYEQARLARETNGMFFMLPSEEKNLAGAGARENRQFRAHDMREYHPLWQSRAEYGRSVANSKFRKTIWDVIVRLNPVEHALKLLPSHDPKLNIRELHYPLKLAEFKPVAAKEVQKAFWAWGKLQKCIKDLEDIQPLRAREASTRWRANYDLARAQCLAFRVRLFQYMLAMDDHVNANPPRIPPPPKNGKNPSNEWNVGRTKKMLVPDEAQFKRIQNAFPALKKVKREEFLAQLKQVEDRATQLYAAIEKEHPGTPWARRARYERVRGYGMRFYHAYRSPYYNRRDIKFPNF
ncbi:MAG: VWA domain-containing protein [Planctomycetaceae bacterium]